jgi:allophanate hydrolase subunit 1
MDSILIFQNKTNILKVYLVFFLFFAVGMAVAAGGERSLGLKRRSKDYYCIHKNHVGKKNSV